MCVQMAVQLYRIQMGRIRVENIHEDKRIKNIQVTDKAGQVWNSSREDVLEVDYTVEYTRIKNGLNVELPFRVQDGQYISIQLSCHDNGWVGFPEKEIHILHREAVTWPDTQRFWLRESLCLWQGRNSMRTTVLCLSLPPVVYGEGEPGKGRWLYGSWIDWEQTEKPGKSGNAGGYETYHKNPQSASPSHTAGKNGRGDRTFLPLGL